MAFKISDFPLSTTKSTDAFNTNRSDGLAIQIDATTVTDAVGTLVLETSNNQSKWNQMHLEYATPGATTKTVVSGVTVGSAPLTTGGSAIINVEGLNTAYARLTYLRTSGGANDKIDIYFTTKG